MLRLYVAAWLAIVAGAASNGGAKAQPADEFFRGKALRFTVVCAPGGTYDLYSRAKVMGGNGAQLLKLNWSCA